MWRTQSATPGASCADGPFSISTGVIAIMHLVYSLMVIVIGCGQPHSSLRIMSMPRSCSYDGSDDVHRSHPFSEIFPSAVC